MSAVAAAVADAHRREWARVLAATVRVTRDLDLAEECVQDAYARALTAWREAVFTDGPYVESKEYVAGFWIIEAPHLDVALRLAALGSNHCNRRVELRPLLSE